MIKRIALIIFLIALVFVVIKSGVLNQTPFSNVSNDIKLTYLQVIGALEDFSERYFNQAKTITRLKEENSRLSEEAQLLSAFASEVVTLSNIKRYQKSFAPMLKTVRVVSYAALPDFQKIWIDYADFNASKVYGLIYNNQSAGIVIRSDGQYSLALLNGDSKCSYAVYVGEAKAPGIAMGKSSNEMVVRYIPPWLDVKEGDEVVTSGLDNIFFAGVKVGKVTRVTHLNAYKEATVEPYYDSLQPDYFYLIETTR